MLATWHYLNLIHLFLVKGEKVVTCDRVHATVETTIDNADCIDDQAKDGQFAGIWAPGSRIGGQQVAVQEEGDRDSVGGVT